MEEEEEELEDELAEEEDGDNRGEDDAGVIVGKRLPECCGDCTCGGDGAIIRLCCLSAKEELL